MSSMNKNAWLYDNCVYYKKDIGPYQSLALPWWAKTPERTYPVRHGCRIEPLVCGERVFGQIANDLEEAKSSVDIITWGFDPGMVLVRGNSAESGIRYGELLMKLATRQPEPVQVRIIVWHDSAITHLNVRNMPGYYGSWPTHFVSEISNYYSTEHQNYNIEWFNKVFLVGVPNLKFRVRDIPRKHLAAALKNEEEPPGLKSMGAKFFPTHHQKMMLIDYERRVAAVGYVMGHNSMTDYWDTKEHKFQDPRRERMFTENPANAWFEGPYLNPSIPGYKPTEYEIEQKERAVKLYLEKKSFIAKPYQDVSCRVCGPVLYDLNHNFCEAWGEARKPSSLIEEIALSVGNVKIMKDMALYAKKKLLGDEDKDFLEKRNAIRAASFSHWEFDDSVQLMRTQPIHEEKTIKECYANLNRLMSHYIFIQNQYVQYKDWVEHLTECIQKRRDHGFKDPMYVFILTSTPERDGMDLSTYNIAYQVGQGQKMPVIHEENVKKIEQWGGIPLTAEGLALCGLNVVMGSLWTCAKRPEGKKLLSEEYEEIYIHAKVAIVDDVAFTMGSANLNLRSMSIDSELNIASQATDVVYKLRCELFKQCTGDAGPAHIGNMKLTHNNWKERASSNFRRKEKGLALDSSLVDFFVNRKPGAPVM